ncbi:Sugar phosphate isomerase/epimerase [Klenkia soli]|uniref:Sugar phosphate isomerase/epimerase n=1 Tax=Klenkia soli TaxID=1052260 RepID=A0A1H0G4H3_9ACTN|nr:sugar phosphate isomerase/epimerase family protein [Klenkia soli]SDO01798.1 Sugar phosphate isomerase/epimerase [Klenkia soli]
MELDTCSLNSITLRSLPLPRLLAAAAAAGFGAVGLWRDTYDDVGVHAAARLVGMHDLAVSSICRAGMFTTAVDARSRRAVREDNTRALDEAVSLGAACLVVVVGGIQGRDLQGSRQMVSEGLADLAVQAESAGVDLAVEPMHPMMAASRSVITSVREANDLLDSIGSAALGLAVDAYHLWWDAALHDELGRAADRVLSVQVSDWTGPIHGELSSRGLPGQGCIDLPGFLADVRSSTEYRGAVEVEVLSDEVWAMDAQDVLAQLVPALRQL